MRKLRVLFTSSFVRSVTVLVGGTAFAQGVALLALPLLTRLYSPTEFGILGVFVALLGMISVSAAGRYEVALPLPERDQDAVNLLAVALLCGLLTTAATAAAVSLFAAEISSLMRMPAVVSYLWMLPPAVALTCAYAVFQFWATRRMAFARVARTRAEQAIGGAGTQLLLGWIGSGAFGLIAGQIVNNGAGFFGLAWRAFSEDRALLRHITFAKMRSLAREYGRFPKYSTWESSANMAAVQLPLILIASFASSAEVGYLMLGMRLMQAPVGLIGSSISQVYYSRAVEEHRKGTLAGFTARSVASLARIGPGPLIFAGIISSEAFSVLFGEEWRRAGELVAWMTPWFVFQFLSSPVSMALQVTSRQRAALAIHSAGLVLRTMMVVIAGLSIGGIAVSGSYALSGCIFYLGYLIAILRVSGASLLDVRAIVVGAIPSIAVWTGLGLGVRALL